MLYTLYEYTEQKVGQRNLLVLIKFRKNENSKEVKQSNSVLQLLNKNAISFIHPLQVHKNRPVDNQLGYFIIYIR